VVFPFGKLMLAAVVGKESVIYLMDLENPGGADHHTPLYTSPRWGNDEAKLHDRGIWGLTTYLDAQGRRWVYAPMLGPPAKGAPKFEKSYGPANQGSTMAFEVVADPATGKPTLAPRWMSREMHAPEPPTAANGVVYVLLSGKTSDESRGAVEAPAGVEPNAVLYALDAQTGQELYSSKNLIPSFTHFNEPVVVGGQVYVCTWDGKIYAFGL
jgi:outer membrane protein assembly factor BamB